MNQIRTKEEQETEVLKQKNRIENRRNDLKEVLKTPQGRRFFWSVLSECGVFHMAPLDERAILFFEGKRAIGLTLIERLNQIDPELFYTIAKESKNA